MKKTIITIAGSIGSGKSTTGRKLAELLGFDHFSGGDLQKKTAESLGMTLQEYHNVVENDSSYDQKVEATIRALGEGSNVVIETRLGFYTIPDSFKLFLLLDPTIAAARMLNDATVNPMRNKELVGGMQNAEQVALSIHARVASEAARYEKYYGVTNHMDPTHFDVIINTEKNNLETVTAIAAAAYSAWLSK